jgi:hypothetical protein
VVVVGEAVEVLELLVFALDVLVLVVVTAHGVVTKYPNQPRKSQR